MPNINHRSLLLRVGRVFAVVFCVVFAGLGLAAPANAHSFLVRTSPATGARLSTGPDEVVLDFSERIDGTPHLSLRTATGTKIDLAFVGTDPGGTRIRANVPTLARDIYLVTWQVLARDGHTTEGEFAFAVGTDLPPGAVDTRTRPSQGRFGWADALIQFEIVAGLAFAFGCLASERLIWATHRPAPTSPKSPAAPSIAFALVGVMSAVALELHRRHVLGSLTDWSGALATRADRLMVATGSLTGLALVAARSSRLRRIAALPVAAALALMVWRGHSGDDSRWWATPLGTAHVIGGAAWAGALLHLTRRPIDRPARTAFGIAARRYSRFALPVVAVTIGIGTIVAFTRFDSIHQLWTTRYGTILLIKLALVVAALVLANLARAKGLRNVDNKPSTLRTIVRVELLAVTAVLAASVALAVTAPPSSAGSFVLGPPPIANATWGADLAGNNLVLVAAVDHQLQIRVLQPGGQPPPTGRATISGKQPDGSDIDITARNCGQGCETISHEWQPGTTELGVTVGESDYAGGTAHVSIEWSPGPDGAPLLAAAVAATKQAGNISLTESVTSNSAASADAGNTRISGPDFISQEPFGNGGDDVHQLADDQGLNVIAFTVPASNIWIKMWIDPITKRIAKETIIDPGHRIEHTISYPP